MTDTTGFFYTGIVITQYRYPVTPETASYVLTKLQFEDRIWCNYYYFDPRIVISGKIQEMNEGIIFTLRGFYKPTNFTFNKN